MYQEKKHLWLRKVTVILLAFIVVFTYMPSEAYAGMVNGWKVGSKAYFKNGSELKASDGKPYYNYHTSGHRYAYCIAPINGGNTIRGYCLERNIDNPHNGDTKYYAKTWNTAKRIKEYGIDKQIGIKLALLYAKQPGSSIKDMEALFGDSVKGCNLDDWWIATQTIIWEFTDGYRKNVSSIPSNVGQVNSNGKVILGTVNAGEGYDFHYGCLRGRPARKIYFAMLKAMKAHKDVPSFTTPGKNDGTAPKTVKTIMMEKVSDNTWRSVNNKYANLKTEEEKAEARKNSDYYILTDTKQITSALKVIKVQDGKDVKQKAFNFIKKGKGKWTLEYTGTSLPTTVQHGKKNIPEVMSDELLVWQNSPDASIPLQTIAIGADDPVDFYFKMTEPTVTPPPPGEPGIPKLPSFTFDTSKLDYNPGWDQASGASSTGMGDAPLDATITLYVDGEEIDHRDLDIYGSTGDDPFVFKPWEEVDELTKEEVPTYDDKGNLLYTDYYWRGSKTVTTKETVIPAGRHPESVTGGTGERNHGTITYYAHCRDDGPFDYNIQYEGEDGNGAALTDEADIDEENPQQMHDEVGDYAYINDNYRGVLQIVKTKNDQDPFSDVENSGNGVKDYSTDSYWTIELESGGWEDCPYVRVVPINKGEEGYDPFASCYRATRDNSGIPADPDHPLKISGHGQIRITDLPYGTYIIKEIKADKNGYVLESYRRTVSKDEQLISDEINNKQKTNVIKVVKTNSETGKTVRWDADRTAFRIKYIGNPDLADPTSATNAGRYLPNGSSYKDDNQNYIFYANKNGEIKLPYEIEYGIYELEELVVPEGYYVGRYDEKGTGTIADMGEVKILNHEGQTVKAPKTFLQTVQVRDSKGNKVEKFTGNNKTTYNTYRFSVLEQDAHMEGADYITYYAIIDMPNNPAKGKIEITKNGEGLAGWSIGDIWKAIWDKITLKDTRYEIYAAKDIAQSDGVIPVKAYTAADDKEIELEEVSRDHSDVDGAKEVWQKILNPEVQILKTSAKDKSDANTTVTEYMVKALNGATYTDSFSVRDDEAKMTCKYTVEYKLNYSKGGFNYTDVHVTKKSIADDYVAKLDITEPLLKNGDNEIGFVTTDYGNGNIVRMNPLADQLELPDDDQSGMRSEYNTDDITATPSEPVEPEPVMIQNPNNPDDPTDLIQKTDEKGNPVFTVPAEIVRPAGWTDVTDEDGRKTFEDRTDDNGKAMPKFYMVTKDNEYQILVKDGDKERWIPCDAAGNYYLSYSQEYDFTLAQHFNSNDGFSFSWDDCVSMTAAADHDAETTTTVIKDAAGGSPKITETEGIYSHETKDGSTTFTGNPTDAALVYFKTNDGIRTEMYLSGKLTHTRITVTQSQLFKFEHVLPMVEYNGAELPWNDKMTPANNYYEYIADENNYVKAERHEVGKDNKEVYYTIDIVSNNAEPSKGFRLTYPDTSEAAAVVTDSGEGAKLIFTSCDDTLIYPIGSAVEVITSNIKGIAASSELPLGEYWVREISSTNGQVNAGEWKKFTLEYEDQYTPLIWDTATYENEAVSVKIDLEKLFETAYESKKYEAGSGAVFGIYTAEEIKGTVDTEKKVDKKTIPADTLVGRMVVENGHAASTIKLPLGKYYIKEISAPAGYKLNGTKYYFNAADILTADQMSWHYKDIGVYGGITQDGENGLIIDFDTLYRYTKSTVNIDGKDYAMDTTYAEENSNVAVSVLDGRTNTQIRLKDGQQTVIKFENGATLTVKAEGQTYTAALDGKAQAELVAGAEGNENFTKTTAGSKTVIKYSPKVTKTNWLSEVTYKYEAPKDTDAGEGGWTTIQPANKVLTLTSPEGTSEVTASVDYAYAAAELNFYKGTVSSVTVDDKAIDAADYANGIKLERIVQTDVKSSKAVINFADGATFTVALDKSGQFDMSASGEVDKNLETESTLTVDGSEVTALNLPLMKLIDLKNTTAKTYARNNTSAGVLNITVNKIKNDKLPDEPGKEPDREPTPTYPSIRTTAKDSETGDHIARADDKVTIIDTVSYYNLKTDQEYTLKGVLMDKDTGKAITVDGKEVTAEKVFTPEKSSGTVDMEFVFDGSALEGKTTVVFEEIYKNIDTDGDKKPDTPADKPTAEHKDINDEGQTIYFPEIKTNATDSDTKDHIANADKKVTITDEVTYTNLIPGKEYTVSGTLMDKATGKALLVDGKKVTAEKTFTPTEANGSITLTFTLDASALAGKTTVVFETLKYNGKTVAVHKDIKDKEQTVRFPEVKTSAANTATGVIEDIVTYKNLIPGKTYTVKGVLMDKETGKPILVDGKQITAEKEFTPSKANGTVKMIFGFKQASLYGKTTVVFEKLYLNGELAAEHQDLTDKDQTVEIEKPKQQEKTPQEPGSAPDTGDKSELFLWLSVLIIMAVTLTLAVRNHRNTKQ